MFNSLLSWALMSKDRVNEGESLERRENVSAAWKELLSDRMDPLRVAIVGDKGVGKSSFVRAVAEKSPKPDFAAKDPDALCSLLTTGFKTNIGHHNLLFQLFDQRASQNGLGTFDNVIQNFTNCAIVMYSVTSRSSFEWAAKYLHKLHCPTVLVGNKAGEEQSMRKVSMDEARAVAASWNIPLVQTNLKGRVNHFTVLHHLGAMVKGPDFQFESDIKSRVGELPAGQDLERDLSYLDPDRDWVIVKGLDIYGKEM